MTAKILVVDEPDHLEENDTLSRLELRRLG
jgi:hypothetical protein